MSINFQIDESKPYYKYKTWSRTIYLQERGENLVYFESGQSTKKMLSILKQNLGSPLVFSRNYHLGPLATGAFLLVLSTMLIKKRWGTDHWTLYMGLGLVAIILLIGLYYLFVGRKYGEVELTFFNQEQNPAIYITEEEFYRFRAFMDTIKDKTHDQ